MMSKSTEDVIYNLGAWLSASMEDRNVCEEFKKAVNDWFELPFVSAIMQNHEPELVEQFNDDIDDVNIF